MLALINYWYLRSVYLFVLFINNHTAFGYCLVICDLIIVATLRLCFVISKKLFILMADIVLLTVFFLGKIWRLRRNLSIPQLSWLWCVEDCPIETHLCRYSVAISWLHRNIFLLFLKWWWVPFVFKIFLIIFITSSWIHLSERMASSLIRDHFLLIRTQFMPAQLILNLCERVVY